MCSLDLLTAHQIAAEHHGVILTALKGSKSVAADSLAVRKEQLDVRKEQLDVSKEIAAPLVVISSTLTGMSGEL